MSFIAECRRAPWLCRCLGRTVCYRVLDLWQIRVSYGADYSQRRRRRGVGQDVEPIG